ncbi:hypothetical protein [Glycocaulis sp.]|uniref:hypothetical protein n=1 Tax=Glycocaulis sp. TaxID=1969725 RepID=UPI003F6EF5D4
MKHLIWAVAASPLLIAATPAPPEPPHPPRMVMVERAGAPPAPAAPGRHGRVMLEFTLDEETGWTDEHDAILDEAMESLRAALDALPGRVEADIGLHWRDREFGPADRERVRAMVERARDRAAEARAEGEHARQAAHLARLHGERAHAIGLRAGARGMEAGLRAIDEALERGEVTRYGETRPMTAEERAELIEARARLEARIAEFRNEHAVFLGDDAEGERRVVVLRRDGAPPETMEWRDRSERRNVRIEDRDGRLRVWLDGEELEGDALTGWLNSEEGQRMIRQRPEPVLAGGE